MFTSVRTPRVYEHIVEQIEQAIVDGRLRRGDRLPPERELVRQFGASRVVVREALRTLEHRGLVEVRHGSSGGHFLRDVDGALLRRDFATLLRLARVSVGQLIEARMIIEPEVAALAAERATPDDAERLRETLAQRTAATTAGQSPRALDTGFHRLVAAAAKNPVHTVLTDAIMGIEADVVATVVEFSEEDHGEIVGAHRAIVEAITAGHPGDARAAMAAHIDDLRHRLRPREAETARP